MTQGKQETDDGVNAAVAVGAVILGSADGVKNVVANNLVGKLIEPGDQRRIPHLLDDFKALVSNIRRAMTTPGDMNIKHSVHPLDNAHPESTKATEPSIHDKPENNNRAAAPVASANSHSEAGKPADKISLEHAQKIFAEARPEDLSASMKNLQAIQARLIDVPYMTPEYLAQAQQRAYVDAAQKLEVISTANHKKSNALTWEVANFSQASGKTMINGDMAFTPATGANGYSANVHHGINGKPLGLDLAEINGGGSINDVGNANLHAGLRGVKSVYKDGTHQAFVAGSLDATVSGVETDPKLGGSATALLVNTHQLAGRPTSEIGGVVVDLKSGNVTGVGSVSQTFNADTPYATTARAVGSYDFKSDKAGLSFEAYQKTGLDGLTVRASANVSDVGGSNDVSGNLGVSYQY
jgi:hypothetical protein